MMPWLIKGRFLLDIDDRSDEMSGDDIVFAGAEDVAPLTADTPSRSTSRCVGRSESQTGETF